MAAIAGDRLSFFCLWHSRLGHPSVTCLRQIISSGSLGNVTFKIYLFVLSCRVSKSIALPFHRSTTHTTHAFDLVHSDIWGPASQPTLCSVY